MLAATSGCQSRVRVNLPSGAGKQQSVIVTLGSSVSTAVKLVDYASPTIDSVAGCALLGNTGCFRNGTVLCCA